MTTSMAMFPSNGRLDSNCNLPPTSILRQSTIGGTIFSSGEANNDNISSTSSSTTTRMARSSPVAFFAARFPDYPISSVHYRPRTQTVDIPTLFYSALDVRRFKEEYHQLLIARGLSNPRGRAKARERSSSKMRQEEKFRQVPQATTATSYHAQRQSECRQDETSALSDCRLAMMSPGSKTNKTKSAMM